MKKNVISRMSLVTALAGMILAIAGVADANAAMHGSHKGSKGTWNTTATVVLRGVTLQPGSYEVKEVNSPTGVFVRFTKVTENYQAEEGLPVYEREIVADVKCTLEELQSKTEETGLLVASDTGEPIGLEIRGSRFKYLF